MPQQKFAVFDVDGTIIRNALFFQIVDQLIVDGHLLASTKVKLDAKLNAYRIREHTDAFNDYAQTAVDELFGQLSRLRIKDYRVAVEKVVDRTWAHTYVYTRELIKDLKSQGYFLIALSGSEMYAVEQFTKHYGFDAAIGEIYEEQAGRFTGNIQNVIHGKGKFLKELVDKYRLSYVGSFAVGDSQSDAAMLGLVENPIAFNPEERLFKTAQEHGWKIVVERKNVIYELEKTNGDYRLK